MKKLAYTLLLLALPCLLIAQKKDKKKKDKEEEIVADAVLSSMKFDSTALLSEISRNACNCIDSVNQAEKNDRQKRSEGFATCIDDQVNAYQLAMKLMASMTSGKKTKEYNISIAPKNSDEYDRYYYDIERWLKDSCQVLNKALATHDEEKEKSFSKNPDAMEAYNKGVPYLQQQNYADALPWFEKAVSIDPEFVFAWDNLGICYRRLEKYDQAIAAYKSSLKIDPAGRTALQNLPVVYMIQKKSDEAIAAYKELLNHYPDDAEVFYGIAIVYYNVKKDMENALDYMCKAYNIYVKEKSAYRSDAEKVINLIYKQMKENGKEDVFNRILKDNKITPN